MDCLIKAAVCKEDRCYGVDWSLTIDVIEQKMYDEVATQ